MADVPHPGADAGACSTCSSSSATRAGTCACSCWAAGCWRRCAATRATAGGPTSPRAAAPKRVRRRPTRSEAGARERRRRSGAAVAGVDLLPRAGRRTVRARGERRPRLAGTCADLGVDVAAGVVRYLTEGLHWLRPAAVRRPVRSTRVRLGSDRPQAGQCSPPCRLRGHGLPGLRPECRGDRPGVRSGVATGGRRNGHSQPCGRRRRSRRRTRISGSSCCSAPSPPSRLEDDCSAASRRVLAGTDVADASRIFEAIRLADPADSAVSPSRTSATSRRSRSSKRCGSRRTATWIARQYANGFADVFDFGVRPFSSGFSGSAASKPRSSHCYLSAGSTYPTRSSPASTGRPRRSEGSPGPSAVLDRGGAAHARGAGRRRGVRPLAAGRRPRRNPGTTADLVTACLFVALRRGIIQLPLTSPFRTATWSSPSCPPSATRSASRRTTWSSAAGHFITYHGAVRAAARAQLPRRRRGRGAARRRTSTSSTSSR